MYFGILLPGLLASANLSAETALRLIRGADYAFIEPELAPDAEGTVANAALSESELRALMPEIQSLGLRIESCRVLSAHPALHADRLSRLCQDFGIRKFVFSAPADLSDTGRMEAALSLIRLADALAPCGAQVLLRNGLQDSCPASDGHSAFEHLLAMCLGKVGIAADVERLLRAGIAPLAFLRRHVALVQSLCLDDRCDAQTLDACFQFARACGITLSVDRDRWPADPLDALTQSRAALSARSDGRARTSSYLNVVDADTLETRVLARFEGIVEAPNWLPDGSGLLYNADGHIYTYTFSTGAVAPIDTGFCDLCNNDHVISADGRELSVSHMGITDGVFWSKIYTMPLEGGGNIRLSVPFSPSFLHGRSPDGSTMAYCAFREGPNGREVDVYTMREGDKGEVRLTSGGFNDGPEFSPDGRQIWYNSTHTGRMQIWRMNADGSGKTQMTFTQRNNWFAHLSPDGARAVYISYPDGALHPEEHLPNMLVELWMMDSDGSHARRIQSFFGGQGSMNVNSWSPDGRHFAYVAYRPEVYC